MKPAISTGKTSGQLTVHCEDRLLTIKEVAELTGLKVSSLYHFTSQHRIPTVRVSPRCVRFRLSALHEWWDQLTEPSQGNKK
jgi:excisionase family DNA binding protein